MGKGLIKKYQKAHWMSDDFGRGKNPTAKGRHRRSVKKVSKNRMKRDFKKSEE